VGLGEWRIFLAKGIAWAIVLNKKTNILLREAANLQEHQGYDELYRARMNKRQKIEHCIFCCQASDHRAQRTLFLYILATLSANTRNSAWAFSLISEACSFYLQGEMKNQGVKAQEKLHTNDRLQLAENYPTSSASKIVST
jgi:hypothetical protein